MIELLGTTGETNVEPPVGPYVAFDEGKGKGTRLPSLEVMIDETVGR